MCPIYAGDLHYITAKLKSRMQATCGVRILSRLRSAYAKKLARRSSVAAIGPSGERLSLIASAIVDDGRATGRSRLGAVMRAKKLKAIAVRGNKKVDVANPDRYRRLRSLWL